MRGESEKNIRDIMDYLESEGYISAVGDEYPVITVNQMSREILFEGRKIEMKTEKPEPDDEKRCVSENNNPDVRNKKQSGSASENDDDLGYRCSELFGILKQLRREIASKQNVPAYVVFSDASLRDMCIKMPKSPAEFLEISGVGEKKLKRYGKLFIDAISEFDQDF